MPTTPIITDAEIAEIRRKAAELPRGYHHDPRGSYDLSGIRTLAELIGYLVTVAREKGWDEVEVVAAFIKVATLDRKHVVKPSSRCGSLATLRFAITCGRSRGIYSQSRRGDG